MRRSDREVTEVSQIKEIIDECKVCRIGMMHNNEVYIVPLNFGYNLSDKELTLYFHSAKEGRKLTAIEENSEVGFEMDGNHNLIEGKEACDYSYRYASIIGNGKAEFINTLDEKIGALNEIMIHQTGKPFEFNEKMADSVCVFKISCHKYSCKRKK